MNMDAVSQDREELGRYLGSMQQLAGIRRVVIDDGRGRGCRLAEANNGSGLEFAVNCDRGLDLAECRFKGVPLAWISRNGVVNPHAYEPEMFNWLRSYTGGMLTTCGLRNVGGPNECNGETFGLHGRISHLPAEGVNTFEEWRDGQLELAVSGRMRESRVFGENLELRRRISCRMGSNAIDIEDEIENLDAQPTPFMMLYHMNLGYPLVAPGSRLETAPHRITPATDEAERGLPTAHRMEAAQPGYAEQVFWHEIGADENGYAHAALVNPALKLKLTISYRTRELPYLIQWKQMGAGDYVLGLEPANCVPVGQAKFAEMGKLRTLAPGEIVRHHVRLTVEEC